MTIDNSVFNKPSSAGSSISPDVALGGLTDLVNGVFGLIATDQTNKANKKINQDLLDYNTAMTLQAWERDDNAHQREVADLEAAGLSPLASLNGSGVTSPLGAPSPIAMQAPQLNANNLLNSALQNSKLQEEKRHNEKTEANQTIELLNQGSEIKIKAASLSIENKKVENQIKHQADLIELQNKQLAEAQRSNKASESLKDKEIKEREAEYQSQLFMKEVQHITGGQNVPYEEVYDYNMYIAKVRTRNLRFKQFIEKMENTSESSSSGKNTSVSNNGSAGIKAGVNAIGTPLGADAGLNGSFGHSESEGKYESYSKNISKKQDADYEAFMKNNPVPIFIKRDEKGYKHAYSYKVE